MLCNSMPFWPTISNYDEFPQGFDFYISSVASARVKTGRHTLIEEKGWEHRSMWRRSVHRPFPELRQYWALARVDANQRNG